MKKLASIGALGLMASCLYAQGLNAPSTQTKEDWEEINFEFNSSILSDGYPSLLRLAELLQQHKDYKVKVTGHTDYVGSATYNDRLALARANTVKSFLVKYGLSADQISVAGDGKRNPEVDNRSKEGRFMNRRVVLTVTDGQGRVIKEGGIGDAIAALTNLQNAISDLGRKQQECCDQILKKLDKLDDILAALKNLQGENDRLKTQLDDLRNQHNALRDQVAGLPKPLTEPQTTAIAHTEAMGAVDEAQRRNKKFSLVGVNIGPTYGAGRTGSFTFSGNGRFFSPFGGDGTHAVQAQGEYMFYSGRQEAQFDIGLVNRFGNLQVGGFGSFKWLDFKGLQRGGSLGQAAFMVDWIFSRGRIGLFGTKGFKNFAILNRVALGPTSFIETFAQVVNQAGVNYLFGAWGNAYFEGNVSYLRRHTGTGSDRPGAGLNLVQPLSSQVAFTVGVDLNETLLNIKDSGRVVFGLQFGNYIRPKEYTKVTSPVPMQVPRIHYEISTRRVGNSAPTADAGPNQVGVPAGTVTLNGSGSSDPDGDPLTFQWQQIGGPTVSITNATAAIATFTAAAGQTYAFRLTVTDPGGLHSSATTSVTTGTPPAAPVIVRFDATPNQITPGQSSTLTWIVQGATTVSIQPNVGNVSATGSTTVTPAQTATYTLTATGPGGTVNATATITVGTGVGNPQIIRFEGNPLSIQPGQTSTLSWTTTGASTVSISGVGTTLPTNGSTTVTPSQTTTYTLTATSSDGRSVTAPITITVAPGNIPQIVTFVATPQNIDAGQSTKLCWQITNATNITITPGVGTNLNANDCATVSPTQTTTYTLTATNATGQIQANTTVNVGQVRILSFTSDPIFSPASGSAVTLSWKTENATSVVLVGNDISPTNLPANGSFTSHPISNSTYTLTAYGPGGQTVSVTISVFVR